MPTNSYSEIRLWRRCKRAHRYKYVDRLQRKKKHVSLFRGTIIHEMINARALKKLFPKSPGKTPEQVLDGYAKKYRVLLKQEKEMYGDLINDCRTIIQGYEREYAADEYETLSSEEFFATTIQDDVKFIGYIDKRVQDRHETMFVKDHKTCRSIPNDDKRFSDYQLITYHWAWNRENPSKQTSGVIWDYLRTKPPAIPELLKNGELSQRENIDTDYFTYRAEIDKQGLNPKNYKEILARLKAKKSTFFRRIVLPAPPKATVEAIVNDLKTSITEIQALKGTESHGVRSMSYDCDGCEFYGICQAELRGLDSDFIRKADYNVKEPEEERGEEN